MPGLLTRSPRRLCGERAFVFIQDYHSGFALAHDQGALPGRHHRAVLAHSLAESGVFRICPWQEQILEGLLGNDVLGFHLRSHCINFADTVARVLEARVDSELRAVIYKGATTKVRSFPISVDFEAIQEAAETAEVCAEMGRLRQRFQLRGQFVALGVDRLDYTKGIAERFRAVDSVSDEVP